MIVTLIGIFLYLGIGMGYHAYFGKEEDHPVLAMTVICMWPLFVVGMTTLRLLNELLGKRA